MSETIVVTAFACDPNLPSEPTIGWLFLLAIADAAKEEGGLRVVAYMNQRSKDATDKALNSNGYDLPIETIGVSLPRTVKFLEHPSLTRFESLVWTRATRQRIVSLLRSENVLLCRHVTFASELLPTPITGIGGRSTKAWGPVGSSGQADVYLVRPRHRHWLAQYLIQRLRDKVSAVMARRTSRSIDIVVASSTVLGRSVKTATTDVIVSPNSVLDKDLMAAVRLLRSRRCAELTATDQGVRIVCVGNLVYLKRFELAISPLASGYLDDAKLVIIGKPALQRENYLLKIAAELGVSDRVCFTGQLSRQEVLEEMASSHVLFHPSARESNSGVVAEATALGVPVACFEGTGAASILDSAGVQGVKIQAHAKLSSADLAARLIEASNLKPEPVDKWDHQRLINLEKRLIRAARQRQARDYV